MRAVMLAAGNHLLSIEDDEKREIERKLLAKEIIQAAKEEIQRSVGGGVIKKAFWILVMIMFALGVSTGVIKVPEFKANPHEHEHRSE